MLAACFFPSFKIFTGRGLSLKISKRMKLIKVRIPKKIKQPSHPNLGRMKELAIIPILAPSALAK